MALVKTTKRKKPRKAPIEHLVKEQEILRLVPVGEPVLEDEIAVFLCGVFIGAVITLVLFVLYVQFYPAIAHKLEQIVSF